MAQKNAYEFQMTLITPYPELGRLMRSVAEKKHCQLNIIEAAGESASSTARRLSPETCDVVLSRSLTVDVIRKNTAIPVVSIDCNALDLLRALLPYRGRIRRVAFFHYGATLPGLACVGAALGLDIRECLFESKSDMKLQLLRLAPGETDLVVGGTYVPELAEPLGFTTLHLAVEKDAAERALLEAVNIARARRTERQRAARLATILDAIEEGIVVLNEYGQINLINPSAERLLDCRGEDLLNRNIRSLMPGLFAPGPACAAVPDRGRVQDVRGNTLVVNRMPILFQGGCVGTVCSLSDAGHIQKMGAQLRNRLRSRGFAARYTFDDMRTRSPKMRQIKELGRLYASTDANLIIYGESGTGKELFAQSVHAASPRAQRPFVAVNCAAIPEGLLESELFGYEEGAFTGARRQGKAGMFELAHTGTLFLDEVGDLPLSLQGRLLRVLQEKELVRVGGTRILSLDVRILCATHRDLRLLVSQGRFRSDLFYRLNVLSVLIPPLRERPEDILDIAVPYLLKHLRTPPPADVLERQIAGPLTSRRWPGNIRELLNTLERLIIVANHTPGVFDWERLLVQVRTPELPESGGCPEEKGAEGESLPLKERLRRMERRIIDQTLLACGQDMGRAARSLGISRMTLWRKLQENAAPQGRT